MFFNGCLPDLRYIVDTCTTIETYILTLKTFYFLFLISLFPTS